MHPTSFFFSHLKKYKTCHCEMLRVLSKDRAYQSQLFSAYNTLTTKPIVKKFCLKNKCHFFPNKKFRLPIFNSYLFNRIKIVSIYAHVSSKPISLIERRIEYLTKALLARFSKINVF